MESKDTNISNRDPITDQKVLNAARVSIAKEAKRMDLDVKEYTDAVDNGTLPSQKGCSAFLNFLRIFQKRK